MLEEKLQNILYTFRSKDVNMENNLSLSLLTARQGTTHMVYPILSSNYKSPLSVVYQLIVCWLVCYMFQQRILGMNPIVDTSNSPKQIWQLGFMQSAFVDHED